MKKKNFYLKYKSCPSKEEKKDKMEKEKNLISEDKNKETIKEKEEKHEDNERIKKDINEQKIEEKNDIIKEGQTDNAINPKENDLNQKANKINKEEETIQNKKNNFGNIDKISGFSEDENKSNKKNEESYYKINKLENNKITVDWTKENVIEYLKVNFKIDSKILDKINEKEIDGEALILLRKKDFKKLGFSNEDRKNILKYIEKNILKLNKDISKNIKYLNIFTENDLDKIWDSLGDIIETLKFGEQLKYLKYLIIKDPPPNINNKKELSNYLRKVLDCDKKTLNKIKDKFDSLLSVNEEELEEYCEDWNIENIFDIYKLKIIIELIKDNKNNVIQIESNKKENNEKEKSNIILNNNANIDKNKIINANDTKEITIKEIKIDFENNNIAANSKEKSRIEDKYSPFYCLIEIFEYQTSQKEITYGFQNPQNEFQKICDYFNINFNFENNSSFIDYNKAKEIKISSFMIWGTQEGLYKFLEDLKIQKEFDDFLKKEEKQDKAGIYLCINKAKMLAYIIIWPGKISYKYSNINEINESNKKLLLTLIRYGFSLSSNSILCLSKNEIDNFKLNEYNNFDDEESMGAKHCKIDRNKTGEKYFKLKNNVELTEGKDKLKNKKIIDIKINKNCLLFFEEEGNRIDTKTKKQQKLEEFSKIKFEFDIYFDDNLNITNIKPDEFYILIKNTSFFSIILKEKLNQVIEDVFLEILKKGFLDNTFKCQYCNEKAKELYYTSNNNSIIYFHLQCKKNIININNYSSSTILIPNNLDSSQKYSLYCTIKKIIIENTKNNEIFEKKMIEKFFEDCEKKFKSVVNSGMKQFFNFFSGKNVLIIDKKVILEEIENLKKEVFLYINKNENEKIKKDFFVKNIIEYKLSKKKTKKIINNEENWFEKWKDNFNKYFNDNKQKINKWIILHIFDKIKRSRKKKEYDIFISYEYNERINTKIILVNLYEIMPIKDSNNLYLKFSDKLGEKETIENYFPKKEKGLIIYKKKDKFEITIKNEIIEK